MSTSASMGEEQRVNSTTSGAQSGPFVAILPDGGYVVTWTSDPQDGSGSGIYLQRYDALGVKIGGETLVNTTTAGDQYSPTVAALNDGAYIVAWMSPIAGTPNWQIFTQQYTAGGERLGGETLVSTGASPKQLPVVTALADGGHVVHWMAWNNPGGVLWDTYAQRYAADGGRIGGETRVNLSHGSDEHSPAVAALAGGGYVVAWMAHGSDGGWGVVSQRYDSGGARLGGEVVVNTTTAGDQWSPTVASLADGGYVVAWQSAGQDGSGWGVYAQRYDAAGVRVGAETRVNTHVSNDQLDPMVAALADGGYVVTWWSLGQDGSGWGAYAQRYDADGEKSGEEFRLSTTVADHQYHSTIAAFPEGGFIAAWTSVGQDGSAGGVYTRTFDVAPPNRAPEAAVLPDQTSAEDAPFSFTLPASADPDGDALGYEARLADGGALPDWLAFDAATRTFSGAPPADFNGDLEVTVVSSDGELTASDTFTLAITPVNDAPERVAPPPELTANEDEGFTFAGVEFRDVDDTELVYAATLSDGGPLPAWLTVDPSTGALTGTPGNGDVGELAIVVTATDAAGASASAEVTLTVLNTNDGPVVIGPIAAASVQEDAAYTLDVTPHFADADRFHGDVLSYSASNLPAWLSIDPGTGVLSGTPGNGDVGELAIVVTATDAAGASASAELTLTVVNTNDGPVAVADGGAVLEDGSVVLDVLGNDQDDDLPHGDGLSILSLSGGTSALGATIAVVDGKVVYEADADTFDLLAPGQGVEDSFTYTVVDRHGAVSQASVSVQVTGDANNLTLDLGNGADTFTDVGERDSAVSGGNGADRLFGFGGADRLDGGSGDDLLDGGAGRDTLRGGSGADRLTGGDGADVFVFAKAGGADVITDFQVGVDRLALEGIAFKKATLSDVNGSGPLDLVIQFDNGSVTLLDTGPVANWQDAVLLL